MSLRTRYRELRVAARNPIVGVRANRQAGTKQSFLMPKQCYLCHSSSMRDIGPVERDWSVTTDGQFIRLPLVKAQCTFCGLVQTPQGIDDIFAHLSYRDNYAFYDRPNMQAFDAPLYRQYSQWVAEHLSEEAKDCRVLEVGCGAAWVLQNLRKSRPGLHVT